jgi:hypothetical protein
MFMANFFTDFIAKDSDFMRDLTKYETPSLSVFPKAQLETIKYIGKGSVRPSQESCEQYQCMGSKVQIFNATNNQFLSSVHATSNHIDLMSFVWDSCHSSEYKCIFKSHFGATYKCIGWTLGITKWLDPSEINSYITEGYSREKALREFIITKQIIYSGSNSMLDYFHLSYETHRDLLEPPRNNTVAFYFNDEGECLHGARYVETIAQQEVDNWTSKLGSFITISHSISYLSGEKSIYGNEIYYLTPITGDNDYIVKDEL